MSHYMFEPLEINFFDGQQSYQITDKEIGTIDYFLGKVRVRK